MIDNVVVAAKPWDFAQYDVAADGLDPHAVGVAVKPLREVQDDGAFSADAVAFEQVMKKASLSSSASSSNKKKSKSGGKGGSSGFQPR